MCCNILGWSGNFWKLMKTKQFRYLMIACRKFSAWKFELTTKARRNGRGDDVCFIYIYATFHQSRFNANITWFHLQHRRPLSKLRCVYYMRDVRLCRVILFISIWMVLKRHVIYLQVVIVFSSLMFVLCCREGSPSAKECSYFCLCEV